MGGDGRGAASTAEPSSEGLGGSEEGGGWEDQADARCVSARTGCRSRALRFQFRSGISEEDTETMFAALVEAREIVVTETGKLTYPEM